MLTICGKDLPPEKVPLHQARCAACGGTPPNSRLTSPYVKDFFEPWEAEALIMAAPERHWQLVFWVLYETGGRIGEVMHLTKKDLYPALEVGFWTEKVKPKAYRKVGITEDLYDALVNYAEPRKALRLFPYDNTSAWRALRRVAAQVGITRPVRTHMFRHGKAHQVTIQPNMAPLEALTVAAKILGHKRLETTMKYAETTERKAAEAQRRMIEGS